MAGSRKQRSYSGHRLGVEVAPALQRPSIRWRKYAGSAPIIRSGRPSGWMRKNQWKVGGGDLVRCLEDVQVGTMSSRASLVTRSGWSSASRCATRAPRSWPDEREALEAERLP